MKNLPILKDLTRKIKENYFIYLFILFFFIPIIGKAECENIVDGDFVVDPIDDIDMINSNGKYAAVLLTNENDEVFYTNSQIGTVEAGEGNDKLGICDTDVNNLINMSAGDDEIIIDGALSDIAGSVIAGKGSDSISIYGGTIGNSLFLGDNVDQDDQENNFTISDGNIVNNVYGDYGNDKFNLSGGEIGGSIFSYAGSDIIIVSGTIVRGSIDLGVGVDNFEMSSGEVTGSVQLGSSETDDNIENSATMSGGMIGGSIVGGNGKENINLFSGTVSGAVRTGGGIDTVTVNGAEAVVEGNVLLEGGADEFIISDGRVKGAVILGSEESIDNESFESNGGMIERYIQSGNGADTFNLNGGTLTGELYAFGGSDKVYINGADLSANIYLGSGGDAFVMESGNISGSVFLGSSLSGDETTDADSFELSGGEIGGRILGDDGNDSFLLNGGTLGGALLANGGDDTLTLNGTALGGHIYLGDGNDTVEVESGDVDVLIYLGSEDGSSEDNETFVMSGGTVSRAVRSGAGNDVFKLNGGEVTGDIYAMGGDDNINVNDVVLTNNLYLGYGSDIMVMNSGTINGFVYFGSSIDGEDTEDENELILNNGIISGQLLGDGGADRFILNGGTLSSELRGNGGADEVYIDGADLGANIYLGSGSDKFSMSSGSVNNSVYLGATSIGDENTDADSFELSGGEIGGRVLGDGGDDEFNLSGGTLAGALRANGGNDTLTLNGTALGGHIFLGDGNDIVQVESGVVNVLIYLGSEDGSSEDNETFVMSGGTVSRAVTSGAGNDVFELNGGVVTGDIYAMGGADSVTVNGASVERIYLGSTDFTTIEADTFVIESGEILVGVYGDAGADEFFLNGGVVNAAGGREGNDTLTLDGATVTTLAGGDGIDTINLISGTVYDVKWGDGDEGQELDLSGVEVTGTVGFGAGSDNFSLLGGIVGGDLKLGYSQDHDPLEEDEIVGFDNDNFVMVGGSVIGSLLGDYYSNDNIVIEGGGIRGNVVAGGGDDTLTWSGGNIDGLLDGGDGEDTFNFKGIQTEIDVARVVGWENINLISGRLNVLGEALSTQGDAALDVSVLQGGILTFGPAMNLRGNLSLSPGSSLVTRAEGDAQYSISGSLVNDGSVVLQNSSASDVVSTASYSGVGAIFLDVDTALAESDTLFVGGNATGSAEIYIQNVSPIVANGEDIELVHVLGGNSLEATSGSGDLSAGLYNYQLAKGTQSIYLKAIPVSERFSYSSLLTDLTSLPILMSTNQSNVSAPMSEEVQLAAISTSGASARDWDLSLTTFADGLQKDLASSAQLTSWTTGVKLNGVTEILDAPSDFSTFRYGLTYAAGEALIYDGAGENSISSRSYGADIGFTLSWDDTSFLDMSTGIIYKQSQISTYDDGLLEDNLWNTSYFVSAKYRKDFSIDENSVIAFSANALGTFAPDNSFYDNKNNSVFIDSMSEILTSASLDYTAAIDGYALPTEFQSSLKLRRTFSPETTVIVNDISSVSSSDENSLEFSLGMTSKLADSVEAFWRASRSIVIDEDSPTRRTTEINLGATVRW